MNDERRLLCRAAPSVSPPFALSESWFTSDTFVRAVRADIESLLVLFERQWKDFVDSAMVSEEQTKRPRTKGATHHRSGGMHKTGPSVFTAFRQSWVQAGWDKIHISMVDPCLRSQWFRTLTRLLIERLFISRPNDLLKVAALLALYTLWASQPASIPQEHIMVDLGLLQLINSLPHALANLIDSTLSKTSKTALRASDDLFMAVHLLHHSPAGSAFILAPREVVRHPPLPSNHLVVLSETLDDAKVTAVPSTKRRRVNAPKFRADHLPPEVVPREIRSESPQAIAVEPETLEWADEKGRDSNRVEADEHVDTDQLPLNGEGASETAPRGWRAPDNPNATLTEEEVNELLMQSLHSPPEPEAGADVEDSAMQTDVDLVPPSAANDYLNFGEG